jgi:hypothetical protein
LKEIFVKEDPKERVSSQRRDDPGISDERLTCELTGDGVGTIVDVCVALLVLSAGVATYITCARLLLLLTRAIAFLWLHVSPL